MFDIEECDNIIMGIMMDKVQKISDSMEKCDYIKSATVNGAGIDIVFNEEVDIKGQDVLTTMVRGGALKKVITKDDDDDGKKKEDEFILIEPIGDFNGK